jgi:hemerythrin-like domain-containing protein
MKATDILRSEHEVILDVLAAIESIGQRAAQSGQLDLASAQEVLDFLRCFADRCHHGKEEQHLFSAMAARGLPREVGPLAVMEHEHDEGRALIARMSEAVVQAEQARDGAASRFAAAAADYVTLMRDHIDKENGVLFPMCDGMLGTAEQDELLRAFETFEHADMGAGAHERFLSLAQGLVQRLGITRAPRASGAHACCGHGSKCA